MKIKYKFKIWQSYSEEPVTDHVWAESNEDASMQIRERHFSAVKIQSCFIMNMFGQAITSPIAWVIALILGGVAYSNAQQAPTRTVQGNTTIVCQSLAHKTGCTTFYDAISTEQCYLPLGTLSMEKFRELATEYGEYIGIPYVNHRDNAANNNAILHKEECITICKPIKTNNDVWQPIRERTYRHRGEIVPKALFSSLIDSDKEVVLQHTKIDSAIQPYFKLNALCQYKYDLEKNTRRYAVHGIECSADRYIQFRDSIEQHYIMTHTILNDSNGYNRVDSILAPFRKE